MHVHVCIVPCFLLYYLHLAPQQLTNQCRCHPMQYLKPVYICSILGCNLELHMDDGCYYKSEVAVSSVHVRIQIFFV
jgi:hypothetical protein